MAFTIRAWLYGLAAAVVVAALIAAIPTGFDVAANPGEVFRNARGTDWRAVSETFFSWWMPALVLVAPFAVLVFAHREGRRGGDTGCPDCE